MKIRVLISKPGADGHWRGVVTVAKALADAGMEVIYGGYQSIEEIVETAMEEDVGVIGMSIHSGAYIEWTRRLVKKLEEKGVKNDFIILVGGAIPKEDEEALKNLGVAAVFCPGSSTKEIASFIESTHLKRKGLERKEG